MIIQTVMRCHGILLLCTVLLAGCGGTIFNPINLNKGKSVLIDARQRAILNIDIQSDSTPGQVKPKRIVCAEPSPDVAVAVAHSLGGSVGITGKGAFSVSKADAEGLAQLGERVASIQLLRDGLYRACEAYANGAISNITYAMLISRIDEVATTLLLGEVAGGAFGRNLTAIGGQAEAKATISMIQELLKKESQKESPAGAAQPQGGSQPTSPAGQPGKKSGADSTSKVDSESVAKAAISGLIAGGAISGRAHSAEIAEEVAKIHKAFLDDPGLESLMVACVTALSTPTTPLSNVCLDLMKDLDKKLIALAGANTKGEVQKIQARHEVQKIEAETRKICAGVIADKEAKEEDKKTCRSMVK